MLAARQGCETGTGTRSWQEAAAGVSAAWGCAEHSSRGCTHLAAPGTQGMGRRRSTAVPWEGEMSRTRGEPASGGAAVSVQEDPGTSISRRHGEAGQGWGQRTQTLTRAVALKLPQQCCPGPGSRQAPHGHRVSGARAVRRQRVLRDGAAQPQPLDLQEAAVLRAPGGDVQLGTGHAAAGERAQRTASHSPAALRCSPRLQLGSSRRDATGALAPRADRRRTGGNLEPALEARAICCTTDTPAAAAAADGAAQSTLLLSSLVGFPRHPQ